MNAFDFVVTNALGSILASVSLNQNIPIANGVTVILLFIGFQFLFTWLAVRVKDKGSFLYQAMKKERITVEEIYSAARQKGISTLDGIDMIILETTGDIRSKPLTMRLPKGWILEQDITHIAEEKKEDEAMTASL